MIEKILPVIFIAILVSSCSTLNVISDSKDGTDFFAYKTFKVVHFMNEEDHKANNFRVNPMNRERIQKSIAHYAGLNGMKELEQNPDVVLIWAVDIDVEQSYTSNTTYSGGPYWGYRGSYYTSGFANTSTDVNQHYIGILSIAMVVPPGEKDILWYGRGQKDITSDAGKTEKAIDKIVSKIMKEFPIETQ